MAGALCKEHGVRGYPTIMFGIAGSDLDVYTGGTYHSDLVDFVRYEPQLQPRCSPFLQSLCTDAQREVIEEIQKLNASALASAIADEELSLMKAEQKMKKGVKELEEEYTALVRAKTAEIARITKATNLPLMKSILDTKEAEDAKASKEAGETGGGKCTTPPGEGADGADGAAGEGSCGAAAASANDDADTKPPKQAADETEDLDKLEKEAEKVAEKKVEAASSSFWSGF